MNVQIREARKKISSRERNFSLIKEGENGVQKRRIRNLFRKGCHPKETFSFRERDKLSSKRGFFRKESSSKKTKTRKLR